MKDDAINLLLRSFDDDLDVGERARLDDQLDRSVEMRSERERLVRLRGMVAASRAKAFDSGFADRVLRRMEAHEHAALRTASREGAVFAPTSSRETALPQRASSRRASVFGWMERAALAVGPLRAAAGLAAAVVSVLAVGVALWLQPRTVDVPNGALQTVELSDGSTVELSGGSTLTHQHFFRRADRRVELTGEAFFDVASEERPFLVETFNAEVRVLGTRFNVRAWPDEAETDVTLEEGRVAVEPRPAPTITLAMQELAAPVVLGPGEATTVTADSAAAPRSVPLDRVLAWRTGGLFIVDQSLGSAFRTIERRFGVRVTAQNLALRDRPVTYLNPAPESASDVLATICHTLDLRYRRTADGFEVLEQ